ncbi:hypothetical protein HMPREF2600_01765 [Neisseria sp. HMSC077D05]|jgi:hypothetical protein|nr:hypothetical protein HMPREF1028_00423 [Neisseria sp. GT4A_CT1]OFN31472.1 hypothetical protein HMPREF2600_01765 [Neisseria sp. HMSC077D05]
MKIFKLLFLLIVFITNTVVIVIQHENITKQENMLLQQQMEIHMLKVQINLMDQVIVMNNMIINDKAISSKTDN